jgi:hypothetical protein
MPDFVTHSLAQWKAKTTEFNIAYMDEPENGQFSSKHF